MRLLAAVRSLKMLESLTNKMILLFSFILRAITILDCNFHYFSDCNIPNPVIIIFTVIHCNLYYLSDCKIYFLIYDHNFCYQSPGPVNDSTWELRHDE
jgi:hypothetical protein